VSLKSTCLIVCCVESGTCMTIYTRRSDLCVSVMLDLFHIAVGNIAVLGR